MATLASVTSHARKLKVTGWLLCALIAGILTLIVWIASAVKPATAINKKVVPASSVTDPLAKLTNHTPTPSELDTAVKPLALATVVQDIRNNPPQFKDSRFLKANTGKWTVQVMNVAEPDVVTDYLNKREDKDKFTYFRITDEQNQKRYVVTYGLYNTAQEAMSDSKNVNFGLPANVTTFPEEVRLYLSEIDEYEVSGPIKNLGAKTPKEVKLHTVPKAIPTTKPKTRATQDNSSAYDNSDDEDTGDDSSDDSPPTPAPKPARTIERSSSRNETLQIQEKPVPAFVEKPRVVQPTPHPVQPKPMPIQQHEEAIKPRPVPIREAKPSNQGANNAQDDGE